MKTNIFDMSINQLEQFETQIKTKLDNKLHNMIYDEELNTLFDELEEVVQERNRRKQVSNG